MASEDIGNADPRALTLTLDAWQTFERLGSPEGELALAQSVVYMASCAKSNAVYAAFKQAMTEVQQSGSLVERIDVGPEAALLRPAFYFTACDSMLRDYLMWPIYAESAGLPDPLEPYFHLWRHGVKYRIFGESQVDLYLPRQTD